MTANWRNRTLWTGDNLDIMRGMNSETVDLIYLDPPFNSNRDYSAPIGSEAAGAAFKDTWTLSDVDEAWHGEIADRQPALYGRQEGICAGCRVLFPFCNLTVDHIVAQSRGGTDHLDNLQLLCGACNSMKGADSQEQLVAKLKAGGIRQ